MKRLINAGIMLIALSAFINPLVVFAQTESREINACATLSGAIRYVETANDCSDTESHLVWSVLGVADTLGEDGSTANQTPVLLTQIEENSGLLQFGADGDVHPEPVTVNCREGAQITGTSVRLISSLGFSGWHASVIPITDGNLDGASATFRCIRPSGCGLDTGQVFAFCSSINTQCIDTVPVGDGWGWDGNQSCRVGDPQSGICVDTIPVGDGWGWDGIQSCTL